MLHVPSTTTARPINAAAETCADYCAASHRTHARSLPQIGEIIIDDHRHFARLVKEFGGDDTYASLTKTVPQ